MHRNLINLHLNCPKPGYSQSTISSMNGGYRNKNGAVQDEPTCKKQEIIIMVFWSFGLSVFWTFGLLVYSSTEILEL